MPLLPSLIEKPVQLCLIMHQGVPQKEMIHVGAPSQIDALRNRSNCNVYADIRGSYSYFQCEYERPLSRICEDDVADWEKKGFFVERTCRRWQPLGRHFSSQVASPSRFAIPEDGASEEPAEFLQACEDQQGRPGGLSSAPCQLAAASCLKTRWYKFSCSTPASSLGPVMTPSYVRP